MEVKECSVPIRTFASLCSVCVYVLACKESRYPLIEPSDSHQINRSHALRARYQPRGIRPNYKQKYRSLCTFFWRSHAPDKRSPTQYRARERRRGSMEIEPTAAT